VEPGTGGARRAAGAAKTDGVSAGALGYDNVLRYGIASDADQLS